MKLRNERNILNVTTRIGLSFLILASLGNYFLHPTDTLSAGFIDGAKGLLYGIAIGCMLTGIGRSRSRFMRNSGCAG